MSNNLNITDVLESQNQKEITINDQKGSLDAAITEFLNSDYTSADVTLTDAEFRENVRFNTTNLTVARALNLPVTIKRLFIVDNTNGTNTLTVTAGTTTIVIVAGGIGQFYTDATANGLVQVRGSVSGVPQILPGDGTEGAPSYSWLSDVASGFYKESATQVSLSIAGTKEVEFNDTGVILNGVIQKNGTHPTFMAYNSVTDNNVTGNGTAATVDFDTEVYDQGGDFSTDTFTAPVSGVYAFSFSVLLGGIQAVHDICVIRLVTSNNTYIVFKGNAATMRDLGADQLLISCSPHADMDASDTAHVTAQVDGGTAVVDIVASVNRFTVFSGTLIA